VTTTAYHFDPPGTVTLGDYVRDALDISARVHFDQWRIRNGEKPGHNHPSFHGRGRPISVSRRDIHAVDAYTVEMVVTMRRLWAHGLPPVTVEDLAPVTTGADSAALHTWTHVEALPRRPKDLHDIPANAFPRAGDPAPVALTPRVSRRHYARTSTGGAPPT